VSRTVFVDSNLVVEVADAPGAGGAHHHYTCWAREEGTVSLRLMEHTVFQNGPIKENGVNGTSHEALLAIVADRLRSFQAGPYACRENALALTKIEEALHWMDARTKAREKRGVEGTSTV
jgi:hypothetical protein